MARRTSTKSGFLLAEALVALAVLSLMVMLASNVSAFETDPYHVFAADYCLSQSAALASAKRTELKSRAEDLPSISFSDKGNVSMARTLTLGKGKRQIVIELGFGRLVFR